MERTIKISEQHVYDGITAYLQSLSLIDNNEHVVFIQDPSESYDALYRIALGSANGQES